MNKERLLTLARFLREKVPDEHFDLRYWVKPMAEVPDGFRSVAVTITRLPLIASGEQRGCGAAACAIGWCPAAFPSEVKWADGDMSNVQFADGRTEWYDEEDFATEFFSLGYAEFGYLFMPLSYDSGDSTTRHEVADRIEAFVNSDGAMP